MEIWTICIKALERKLRGLMWGYAWEVSDLIVD